MNCPYCGHEMTKRFGAWVCDWCTNWEPIRDNEPEELPEEPPEGCDWERERE